jgi:predicted Fe-S protein YdhL (DUF1289 family)
MQVCRRDNRDICLGSCRTRDEIARWKKITDNEKRQVVSILAERRGGLDAMEIPRAIGNPAF